VKKYKSKSKYDNNFQLYYREVLAFVDWFTALHFMATDALPAARRILILLMNRYA
jgi:hypothetical protein